MLLPDIAHTKEARDWEVGQPPKRLIVNVGIVVAFGGFALRFRKRP